MAALPSVSVVLPTYNEAENIIDLIDDIRSAMGGFVLEIIVVDDNSPDGTWKLVAEKAAVTPGLHLIHRVNERGLTSAIWAGIQHARNHVVCWMDCDFSHPPQLLPTLVSQLSQGFDLAVGSRYVEGGKDARAESRLRMLLSSIITKLANYILIPNFKDYTSGFIAIRRQVFDTIQLRGNYGEYFIDLVFRAHRSGYKFVEIPYENAPRRAGVSKTESGMIGKGFQYLWIVARLRFEAIARKPDRIVTNTSHSNTQTKLTTPKS
ncbi:MAG: polyprenol monophosphomannose synthase [Planctomycetota bacterium]